MNLGYLKSYFAYQVPTDSMPYQSASRLVFSIKTKLSAWKVFMFALDKKMIKHFVHGSVKNDDKLNMNEKSSGIKLK